MKITTRDFVRSACATVLALGCGISIAAAQPAVIVERGVMPAPPGRSHSRTSRCRLQLGPGPLGLARRRLGLDSRPSHSRRRPGHAGRGGRSGAGAARAGVLLGQGPSHLRRGPLGVAPGRLAAVIRVGDDEIVGATLVVALFPDGRMDSRIGPDRASLMPSSGDHKGRPYSRRAVGWVER